MEKLENNEIPSIKLRNLNKETTSSAAAACNDVRRALETYGCFVAVFDDEETAWRWSEVREEVFGTFRELFDLSIDTKRKNPSSNVPSFGYEVQTKPFVESMGIVDPTNLLFLQNFVILMWPSSSNKDVSRHKSVVENLHGYLKTLSEVAAMVGKMVLESYGVVGVDDGKHLDHPSQVGSGFSFLFRVMKYGAPEANSNVDGDEESCTAHTDLNLITVLDQNHVDGLQFQSKDGEHWIPAHFPPSSFVILAGDALRAWSNGRIHAPVHRVMMKGRSSARYSTAMFMYSKEKVEAPKELIDDENPAQFKALDNLDYLRFFHEQGGQKGDDDFLKTYCGV